MRRYAKYRTMQIRNRQALEVENPAVEVPSSLTLPSRVVKAPEPQSSGFKYVDDEEDDAKLDSISRPAPPMKPAAPRPRAPAVPKSSNASTDIKTGSRIDAFSAKKKLQQAISAIEFSDYPTAVSICREVVQILSPE